VRNYRQAVAAPALHRDRDMTQTTLLTRTTPAFQGYLYIASGLWPIVHLRSFEKVTGPKADGWLVKTVGGLLAVIGASLVAGNLGQRPPRALRMLGLGSAAVLALIDVVYASRGRISKVYLADAALQAGIAGAWIAAERR
jgi:hypothetical protein